MFGAFDSFWALFIAALRIFFACFNFNIVLEFLLMFFFLLSYFVGCLVCGVGLPFACFAFCWLFFGSVFHRFYCVYVVLGVFL